MSLQQCFRAYIVWARNIYVQIFPISLLIANVGKSLPFTSDIDIHLTIVSLSPTVLMAYRLYVEADSTLAKQNEAKYYRRLDNISIIFMIATLVLNIFNTGEFIDVDSFPMWSGRHTKTNTRHYCISNLECSSKNCVFKNCTTGRISQSRFAPGRIRCAVFRSLHIWDFS